MRPELMVAMPEPCGNGAERAHQQRERKSSRNAESRSEKGPDADEKEAAL